MREDCSLEYGLIARFACSLHDFSARSCTVFEQAACSSGSHALERILERDDGPARSV
jgi:hypothetical protein